MPVTPHPFECLGRLARRWSFTRTIWHVKRINWRVAIPATVLGVSAVVGGLAVDDFSKASVSAVLINVGVALGLLVILLTLERRLLRRVAEVAETAAQIVNTELRERVVRLENLNEAQAEERIKRQEQEDQQVAALLRGEVTRSSVGDLLVAANEERLFDDWFAVRTSDDRRCHLLYFLPLVTPAGVEVLWLSFERIVVEGGRVNVGQDQIPVPRPNDATVMWIHDQDAAEVAADLENVLKRRNDPVLALS